MIKLTRLNQHPVGINPDHISWADATPDTTLFLIGGEKILVRETLEELLDRVLEYRRLVRIQDPTLNVPGTHEGDPPRISGTPARRSSDAPCVPPYGPRGGR